MSLARFQSRPAKAVSPISASPGPAPAISASPGPATEPGAPAGRVHVVTFGCQMNKYDSLLAEGRFRAAGWEVAGTIEEADAVLFNTCSVREHAEDRTWSWLGELKREKQRRPDLVIGVMGCMAQRVGEEIFARAGHVDIVAGTRRYHHLPGMVADVRGRRRARVLALEMDDPVEVDRAGEPYDGGPCAWLTVMRGCDLSCAFCIVPTVRGRVLSRGVEDVAREAAWLVSRGARAITLLGQTVNSYGEDFPAPGPGEPRGLGRQGRVGLADLLRRLQELPGLLRIRLVTLHPAYVTRELARAMRDCDKVERFLPLPAQSGSDAVLRAMKRGYTTDLYRGRVELLREHVEDLELGSDWIVGFPGESEEDFAASEEFLAGIGFASSYVFRYSPRPGTGAAERLEDDVPEAVKAERNARLLARAESVALRRLAAHVGAERTAFVEAVDERAPGRLRARTIHGLAATFRGETDLVGRVVRLKIEGASAYGLSATRVPREG